LADHRHNLNSGVTTLTQVCRAEGLRIAADRLALFSHWITPLGAPRRFDTRFFLAAMPELQDPLHDHRETVDSTWVRPADALARAEGGEMQIIFPTAKNLEQVGQYATVEDALSAAYGKSLVPLVQPKVVRDELGMRVVVQGDPGYDDATEVRVAFPRGSDASHSGRLQPFPPGSTPG
jgi:hypothetical protein